VVMSGHMERMFCIDWNWNLSFITQEATTAAGVRTNG